MKKLKFYLETTVFNRYFEPERDSYSETRLLFEEIAAGKFEGFTSVYVIEELSNTADGLKRKNMLELVSRYNISILDKSTQAAALADEYARLGIISEAHTLDRLHVACASVNRIDAIISFNFSHINRLKTKMMIPHANRIYGYEPVSICIPLEVIGNDE